MTCCTVNFAFAIKYKLRRAKRVEKWQLSAFLIYAGPQIAISIVCVCVCVCVCNNWKYCLFRTRLSSFRFILSCILKIANAATWWS
jgi:ABC-type multidrug transport system permease subunit